MLESLSHPAVEHRAARRTQVLIHNLADHVVGELIGLLPLLFQEAGLAGGVEGHHQGLLPAGGHAREQATRRHTTHDRRHPHHLARALR